MGAAVAQSAGAARRRLGGEELDLPGELGDVADERLALGQELVERRVERADRHAEAVHRLEQPLEVGALERQQRVERPLVAPARGADSPIDADRCTACAAPFTIDAAPTGSGSQRRAAGIAAITLGAFGLASFYLPFLLLPSGLAMVLGLRACAGRGGLSWMGMLGAGLGFVGASGGVIGLAVL